MKNMEDKSLTEKESLELIARMIKETQRNVARFAAYPLLIWGYLTIAIALVVWLSITVWNCVNSQYLWWLLPVVAGPLTVYYNRRDSNCVVTYMDRITGRIWLVFGIVGFLLSVFSFISFEVFQQAVDIYFMIPLLMAMGVILSGYVAKYRPMVLCGWVGMSLSFSLLFVGGVDRLLVFAALFAVIMVVPGHLLNQKMKRECSRN